MAEAVGTIRVDLFANLAEWTGGLSKAEGQLKRFAQSTDKIASGFTKAGKTMSAAITAPFLIVAGLATKAASDAADLQGAFNVTFGDAADAVTAWAKTTGDDLSRSTQQVETTAIAFKDFFDDFTPSSNAAVELSKRFTTLTADFASFKNISDEQAQGVLLKGLSGSAKGLKQFGIDIGDAAVEARALQLGITDGTGALSDQQKVLARASIIMQGFSKAQGENARSAGETDQETRRLKKNFDDLLVTVGNDLIPIFNDLVTEGNKLIGGFNALDPQTRKLIEYFGLAAAAAGPLALGLGGVFKAVSFGGTALKSFVGTVSAVPGFMSAIFAPSTAAAKAIKATGDASAAAAPAVGKLGLSIAGATTLFAAFAPVAFEVGKDIVRAFQGPFADEGNVTALAEVARQKFLAMGQSADEARASTQQFLYAVRDGKNFTFDQVAALGKQQLATEAATKANDEFVKSVDAAIEEAAAQNDANQAAAKSKADLDDFIKSLGNLQTQAPLTAAEMQRLHDAVDPVGAALREYNRDVAAAKTLGLDATQTQKVFGQAFVDSTKDLDAWLVDVNKLPPALAAYVKAQDDANAKAEDFGPMLLDEFKNFTPDFSDFSFLQQLTDSLAATAEPQFAFAQRTQDMADALTAQFDPLAVYAQRLKDIDDAYATGAVSADVYAKAKAAAFADTPAGQKEVQFVQDLTDEFTNAATGCETFADAFKNLVKDFLKGDVIKPALQSFIGGFFPNTAAITAPTGGGFDFAAAASGIASFFGFGGTHDRTGPAYPGMTYRIGSGVEEYFTPDVKGQITRGPGNTGGRSGVTVVQNFNGPDPGSFRRSERQMARTARKRFAIG